MPQIAWRPLIGSGVFIGLALLTKLPGVLLLPWAALLAGMVALAAFRRGDSIGDQLALIGALLLISESYICCNNSRYPARNYDIKVYR